MTKTVLHDTKGFLRVHTIIGSAPVQEILPESDQASVELTVLVENSPGLSILDARYLALTTARETIDEELRVVHAASVKARNIRS